MRPFAISLALSLLAAAPSLAQKERDPQPTPQSSPATPTPRRPARAIGYIEIGDEAPGFELDASDDRSVTLRSLRGGWIALVFADRWQTLAALRATDGQIRDVNARIVGVCHEKAHTIEVASRRDGLSMVLLADPTGEVSSMYGLYNFQRSETEPGLLILDPRGVVQLAVLGHLPPPDVIARLTRFAITGD